VFNRPVRFRGSLTSKFNVSKHCTRRIGYVINVEMQLSVTGSYTADFLVIVEVVFAV